VDDSQTSLVLPGDPGKGDAGGGGLVGVVDVCDVHTPILHEPARLSTPKRKQTPNEPLGPLRVWMVEHRYRV